MLPEKTGKRMVTRSEESITRMVSSRFPHHGNRSFARAQDDVLPLASLFIYYLLLHICI